MIGLSDDEATNELSSNNWQRFGSVWFGLRVSNSHIYTIVNLDVRIYFVLQDMIHEVLADANLIKQ